MTARHAGVLALSLALLTACAHKPKGELARGEAAASDLEQSLRDAERDMRALKVEDAQDDLNDAKEKLKNPDLKLHPEAWLLEQRYNELVGQLAETKRQKEARELELKVEAQRQNLERARTKLLTAMDALDQPDVSSGRIGDVKSAMGELRDRIEDGKALEAKAPSYADDAAHAARGLERARDRIALAELRMAFVEGPASARTRGADLLAAAKKERELTVKQQKLQDARKELQTCADAGAKLSAQHAELAKSQVLVGGKVTTPSAVTTDCERSVKSADKLLAAAEKALAKKAKADAKKAARGKKARK